MRKDTKKKEIYNKKGDFFAYLPQFTVDFEYLTRHISAPEALDILLTEPDALRPPVGTVEDREDGGSHTLDIIGVDIQAIGTACLL